MSTTRSNTVLAGLALSLLAPQVERLTGYKLTLQDVSELFGAGLIVWHGLASFSEAALALFMRYYPPPPLPISPNPTQPAQPAKESL